MMPSAPCPSFSEEALAHRADPLGLELRRPRENRWAAIQPNTTPGQGPVKLQYFSPTGLAGHRAYATPQAARRAAQRSGYTILDLGAMSRLASSEAWRSAYAVPATTVDGNSHAH